ncbi:MAG TPA: hypothetical protein VGC21_12405 [Telluria sp.]|jgi:hypothetical protein
MKLTPLLISAVLMMAASSGFAADKLKHPSNKKLIGAWQEKLAEAPAGNVIVFGADHVYRMYPKCGAEAADFKARGFDSLDGKWYFDKDGVLHIDVVVKGESRDALVPIVFEGAQLVMPGDDKAPASRFDRFKSALPPACN